ncbi:glycosyltransferase family 4 protein [Tamlana sp. 2201CG12-4]|uniref:glycosyltransferase family 4 protein n=1 Tax=Tamlana sp. 2201CG12-4 TaxID=3112582 RepID=UPI002DB7526A|nr:glycosyltransferase family 4 protein [Tamlana sp. 2201CG12-4]MEC3907359.1 glycosyltransferase family 4 protein [Tamlana sp. 2201CG12-4]
MKNLLYIGNQLLTKNKTVTTIDTLSRALQIEGYKVITASNKRNMGLRLLDMLYQVIKFRKQVDYVLIDTYSTFNFYYAYLVSQLCRILKLKYIPILHGGDLPNRLKESPKLSKAIFKKAYINVAPSLYTKSNFENLGYHNIICIPNTIDLENYNFEERAIGSIRLLWVRSFSKIYNPLLAVKILKRLRALNFNASLCMIGPDNDGSLKETMVLANELGVEIEFTGGLTKKEWHKKARAFNIFINTTNVDNMPVTVIEAMALGLPVISTNVGGMPFLIENNKNGILVKPNSVKAFVEAIKKIIDSPDVSNTMVKEARKDVEQFDWKIVKSKWIKLLE